MARLPARTQIFLLIDGILILLCFLHVPSLVERAQSPFRSVDEGAIVRVTGILDTAACRGLAAGDELLSFDRKMLPTADAIEFLANFHVVGDTIDVTLRRSDGTIHAASVRTIPFYKLSYRIVVIFVALLTWFLGIFVLLARPRDLIAAILHGSMASLAVIVITAFEGVTPNSIIGFTSSVMFYLSYLSVATTFYLFTTLFPKPRPGSLARRALILYMPAIALAGILSFTYGHAIAERSVERFLVYNIWYDVMHIAVLLLVGAGIFNVIRSYRTASSTEDRRKIQWVLWGLCLGPTPFLALNVIPELFQPTGLVPEEFTLVFLVFIPASFAISVARYHLFDVELVIRRTTAYAVVLTLLIGVYAGIVAAVASLAGQFVAGAGGAILVALLFDPLRVRVQRSVDKRFFRVRYNFQEAQTRFIDQIKSCMDDRSVAQLTVMQTARLIFPERVAFCAVANAGHRLHVLAQEGFDPASGTALRLPDPARVLSLRLPVAGEGAIEPGVVHETGDRALFDRWAIALAIPLLSENSELEGVLALGKKKSGTRFTADDIELLTVFAIQAGLALRRIRLQKQLFEEQAESRRLEELSELKSDFVSYVSHELRTPLTSIKMFTQLLRSQGRKGNGKSQEYLHVIEGETDRLSRMVTTILDSARIDEGRKEYRLSAVDLAAIAECAVESMKYQLEMQEFRVQVSRPARPVGICGDGDAIADAIMNLIANAIKYSADRKWIEVKVGRKKSMAVCSIEDRGVGISPEAIPHLFEKFYRDPTQSGRVQGLGLGLPLVKHVMDAHGGTIDVRSERGRGTRISLQFPLPTLPPDTGGNAR